jgi:hypothetical protein
MQNADLAGGYRAFLSARPHPSRWPAAAILIAQEGMIAQIHFHE